MPQFVVISREHHAGKKWQRFTDYRFTSTTMAAPLVAAELASAALAMPLAFAQHGGGWLLAAVLSLTPDRNMLVTPDGRWMGGGCPGLLPGSIPLSLAPKPGTDEVTLCIDANSGLVVEGGSAGEDFFDQDAPCLRP